MQLQLRQKDAQMQQKDAEMQQTKAELSDARAEASIGALCKGATRAASLVRPLLVLRRADPRTALAPAVCYARPVTLTVRPCRHACLCEPCGDKLATTAAAKYEAPLCPICRGPRDAVEKTTPKVSGGGRQILWE
jgi:hypothetical protein